MNSITQWLQWLCQQFYWLLEWLLPTDQHEKLAHLNHIEFVMNPVEDLPVERPSTDWIEEIYRNDEPTTWYQRDPVTGFTVEETY